MQGDSEATPRVLYGAEVRELCRRGTENACLLAVAMVPAFAILDAVLFPSEILFFVGLRLMSGMALAITLWMLNRPFGARHPHGLALAAVLVLAAMLDVMILRTGGAASPYYAGLNLLMLGIGILVPWAPRWAIASSLVVVASYVVTVLAAAAPPDPARLANNLFFLAATALITVLAAVIGNRLRWKEFRQRAALLGALQHKREFLARMSHELRTPLHVIVGYSDILLESGPPAASAERGLLERLRERAVFLHRMISDLLDYEKVEAGKMEVNRDKVRIDEVLSLVAGAFRPLTQRKGLGLEVSCDPRLPPVTTDRQRVEQILTNLVGNAVKFTERGGVRIEARSVHDVRQLRGFTVLDPEEPSDAATALGAEAQLAILVHDTGIGIPVRSLRHLAEDFHQIEDTSRYGGTGLGLSISRRLAGLLGGRIGVRTEPGRGSTFALLLPLDEDVVSLEAPDVGREIDDSAAVGQGSV